MPVVIHEFADHAALDAALSEVVAQRLSQSISERGRASLVVSGGRTPVGFFHALSRVKLLWREVTVALADERWVAPDHPDSNEALVRSQLMQSEAKLARLLGVANTAATVAQGAANATAHLSTLPRPFDVVVLGMGNDGHTASLFPDAPELAQAFATDQSPAYVAVTPSHAPHARVSLNAAALLDSRCIALHVAGEDKRKILEHAMRPGAVSELPVRILWQNSETPVHVYWAP